MKNKSACKKALRLFLLTAFLFLLSCSARTEPEGVWNLREKMINLAVSLTGVPYKYGGLDIEGFDCSGFVHYVYDCFGIELPRSAKTMSKIKGKIKLNNAQPADILVFKLRRIWHAAIYLGDNMFIHSPNRGGTVRTEQLTDYWKSRLKTVLRVLND
ncbi:MAG: C40 family peptidase [Candidatus Omnitrophota bacterium]